MIITPHQYVPKCNGSAVIPGPQSAAEFFSGFFELWLGEQNRDLEALTAAIQAKTESTWSQAESAGSVSDLVSRVMGHYENYYRVKFESMRQDVVRMFTPAWRSHLEDAFLWVGGWRPTMAFHLLYSISGLQCEARLADLMRGIVPNEIPEISPHQLRLVDDLQRKTIKEEKALTEILASLQETVADSSMVELSHLVTEANLIPNSVAQTDESVSQRVDSTIAGKEEKLVEILKKADDLRLRTLKQVVEMLGPIQAANFLIAAAELHLRVHEWGMKKDGHAHGGGGIAPTNGNGNSLNPQ